jgi:alkylation response protein AidB-like acyl-CoA dehydrogenase
MMIADMMTDLELLRVLSYRAARSGDAGLTVGLELGRVGILS